MSEITVIEAGGLRLSVRYLTSEDLGQFIALSSSVSWRLSFDELKIMHKADPQSFIGAFLDDGMLISKYRVTSLRELFVKRRFISIRFSTGYLTRDLSLQVILA